MDIKNSNITINVGDLDTSISFYQSIGFTLKQRWNDHYAQLTAPGIVIGLHPTTEPDTQRHSGSLSIGFTTSDFEAAQTELNQLGIATIERTEAGGDFLHFNDPDGTALYFISPKW